MHQHYWVTQPAQQCTKELKGSRTVTAQRNKASAALYLHEKYVRLIQYKYLYWRKEVKISIFFSLSTHNNTQAKWWSHYYVSRVEIRV